MGKHFEKGIRAAQEVVVAVGQNRPDETPMTREQVESFIRGFGISKAGVDQIVKRWMQDQERANDAGWESRADSEYYCQ